MKTRSFYDIMLFTFGSQHKNDKGKMTKTVSKKTIIQIRDKMTIFARAGSGCFGWDQTI